MVSVRAGAGGPGERGRERKAKRVKNFKYTPGRSTPKWIELPPAEPADGGRGGDVVLVVDTAYDSLLHLHRRTGVWEAKKGPPGAAAPDNAAGRAERMRVAPDAKPLRIPVPPGTVVRRKRTGTLLGDLTEPGQALLVARGGRGGLGIERAERVTRANRRERQRGDRDWLEDESLIELDAVAREATAGEPGEEVTLELLMRVVADVGLVGLPNAGKSSLLAASTRASPNIQPYPFTTLMPNLGVVGAAPEGGPAAAAGGRAVLADLPGLIEDAHKGRGLGREFLRHLRRTRAMVVVVDASAPDPAADYRVVREELRMYNPDYVRRPHVLALNKLDVPGTPERLEEIRAGIEAYSDSEEAGLPPSATVAISAKDGEGVDELLRAVRELVGDTPDVDEDGFWVGATDGTDDEDPRFGWPADDGAFAPVAPSGPEPPPHAW